MDVYLKYRPEEECEKSLWRALYQIYTKFINRPMDQLIEVSHEHFTDVDKAFIRICRIKYLIRRKEDEKVFIYFFNSSLRLLWKTEEVLSGM